MSAGKGNLKHLHVSTPLYRSRFPKSMGKKSEELPKAFVYTGGKSNLSGKGVRYKITDEPWLKTSR